MSGSGTVSDSGIFSREIHLDLRPLWLWIKQNPVKSLVGIGIFLRIWEYLGDRSYWLDEASLLGNLTNPSVLDFSKPLLGDQLAPFGFIIAERAIHRAIDFRTYSMRLIPLISGIAAVFLFAGLSRRALASTAALVAISLFCLSSELIYYSSELKQYSSDLAISLLVLSQAQRLFVTTLTVKAGISLAALALASPWLSFASSFVVVASGITLLGSRLFQRKLVEAGWIALIGCGWAMSFLLCYKATHALLSPYTTMYIFWDFAFLPFPPTDIESGRKFLGILLDVFVNPLNLVAPILPGFGVIVPLLLFMVGMASLAKRKSELFCLFVLPIALAMIASGLRKFPFHGRLILELIPLFLLFIAEGTEWVREVTKTRPWMYRAMLVLLLAYPLASGVMDGLSRSPRDFDPHGDLRHNLFLHERPNNSVPHAKPLAKD